MNATEIRRGMVLNVEGSLFLVTEFQHITPGNWRAMVQAKLKNLKTGKIVQQRFRSTDSIDAAFLEMKNMEYLYQDGENYCFMDTQSYDQVMLSKDVVGEAMQYVVPNSQVKITFHEGKALSIDLPSAVVLKVTKTDPGVKGDTVTNVFKPALLETGLEVKVPLFLKTGDKVKVDTRTGEFLERAND